MIDIKNVRPGDAITLEHPDGTTLARRVLLNGPTVNAQLAVETMPRGTWVSIARLLDDGWSITDHKPAYRLVPEGSEREQALAEVVQWFERDGYFGLANEIREHFGVTP